MLAGIVLAATFSTLTPAPASLGQEEAAAQEASSEAVNADSTEGSAEDLSEDLSEDVLEDSATSGATVVVARVDAEINKVSAAFIRRLVEDAEEEGAELALLHLNTLGGAADSALTIRDDLLASGLPTAVFIDKRAISAGAMISLACDHIAIAPGGTIGAAAPVLPQANNGPPQAVGEKYVSFFREEMRSTAETKGRNGDIAAAMVDQDLVVEGISEEGKLLTLTSSKAVETGIADFEADSLEEVLAELGYPGARVVNLESSWAEELAAFLTSPSVASLLFTAMLILGYLEYQTPGFGVFGAGALTCFLVLFFSHHVVNLAGWEEVSLFVIGIVLLAVELFVLPGFGIAGLLGVTAILASAILLAIAGDFGSISFDNPFTVDTLTQSTQRVLLSTLVGFAGIGLLLWLLPRGASRGFGGHLVLSSALDSGAGVTEEESLKEAPALGSLGEAITPLRPAGRARFGSLRVEVETEGGFIEKGSPVRVLEIRGGRAVVALAEGES
ncbi:MAG: NfeD family protein [Acidobacteriota bacterium]